MAVKALHVLVDGEVVVLVVERVDLILLQHGLAALAGLTALDGVGDSRLATLQVELARVIAEVTEVKKEDEDRDGITSG